MRSIWVVGVISFLLCFGGAFSVFSAETVEPPKSCQLCGMDRGKFAYSRMVIYYADGTKDGVCSLHCAVEQMKLYPKKQVKSLRVADYDTKTLIDAQAANWVIGGGKPGVMTETPKWAFLKSEDAQRFIDKNGGRMTTFNEALDIALKEE